MKAFGFCHNRTEIFYCYVIRTKAFTEALDFLPQSNIGNILSANICKYAWNKLVESVVLACGSTWTYVHAHTLIHQPPSINHVLRTYTLTSLQENTHPRTFTLLHTYTHARTHLLDYVLWANRRIQSNGQLLPLRIGHVAQNHLTVVLKVQKKKAVGFLHSRWNAPAVKVCLWLKAGNFRM